MGDSSSKTSSEMTTKDRPACDADDLRDQGLASEYQRR